jgi:acyl dehydratase
MSDPTQMELPRLPSMAGFYARALLVRRPRPDPSATQPRIVARVGGVPIAAARVAGYRAACAFAAADSVPSTYPQVLAAPVLAELMLSPRFVLPIAGIIHVRSRVRELRPLVPGERVDIEARVDGLRPVKQGLEADLETRISRAGEPVWESTTTVLGRTSEKKGPSRRATVKPLVEIPLEARAETWSIPGNTGRRYARVSGDYNPIHLFALSARLFGFDRPIAHGMWSLARCLAAVENDLPPRPRQTEVEFKRPILLPAEALFVARGDGTGTEFALHLTDRSATFLSGSVRPLPSPAG